eukprot:CAMPEP_0180117986 /NCGR_PEP_ID=MMETSP0986-20121125/1215_1 /TAXON_ID=697907 /ORGANISM="non described non described, Strain CCMP2293" /LENGTH=255 /DNA_ID=CAMNT_0022056905 /DNA_START=74 /DNA_END=840 /DNA_ORIENTATION=+
MFSKARVAAIAGLLLSLVPFANAFHGSLLLRGSFQGVRRGGDALSSRAVMRQRGGRVTGLFSLGMGVGSDGDGVGKKVTDIDSPLLYQELREMLAVTGSEAAEGSLLPNEALSAQQAISSVLHAMKASPKFGCKVFLRFASEHNEYHTLSSFLFEQALREGGETQVLLGNFRTFSFPLPTFESALQAVAPVGEKPGVVGRDIAVQEVKLEVPGFMAAMMGATRGVVDDMPLAVAAFAPGDWVDDRFGRDPGSARV